MTRRQITLTFEDVTRLRALLASRFTNALSDSGLVPSLHAKLDRARIVVGTAILGCRVRDTLQWPVPVGWRRLKVEDVWHHPKRGETFESERGLPVGEANDANLESQAEGVGAFSSNPS
jgi:hypothetical protein